MDRNTATTAGLYDAVQGLLLVNLMMESVLLDLLPLLPLAKRQNLVEEMKIIRETLDDLTIKTRVGSD